MGLVNDLEGHRVYLDTNIFIYALNGFPAYAPTLVELFDAIESGGISAATSELTLAELLIVPFRHGNADEEKRCRMILRPRPNLPLLPVSIEVLETMARMRAAQPLMRTPDAIHAATARLSKYDVFLTNDRRLRAVPELRILLLSDVVTR